MRSNILMFSILHQILAGITQKFNSSIDCDPFIYIFSNTDRIAVIDTCRYHSIKALAQKTLNTPKSGAFQRFGNVNIYG